MESYSREPTSKKLRVLTVSLIFSGALNIGLIATGLFNSKEEKHIYADTSVQTKLKTDLSIDRFFTQMKTRSFSELITYLTSQELVANGYLKRDLALGALVAFHDFHIDKVLSGTTLQKKEILLGDGTTGVLFPGLNTSHFDAIIRFAYEEKWPLTSNGIYKAILKSPSDKSLSQAFSMTPEFRAFELLFQKVQLPKEMLIQLVIEGPFSQLQQFAKEQSERLDLTPEKRRSTLLNYVRFGSKTAGKILAETESPFLVKKLDDPSLIQVLSLLKEKTSSAEFLCLELLRSPRSNDVWMAAVNNLYAYAGKEPPAGVPLREAMAQFLPSPSSEPKVTRSLCRKHVVKEGETFWKIARMYDVKVDDLVSANEIDKNHLRVGMTLNIPE